MLYLPAAAAAESPYLGALNVTRYITFRTAAASLTALAISLVLGPWMIRKLRDFQIGQVIRQEGPQSHRAKAGTPTMGGLLILTAALVPTLLWADLSNPYIWIAVLATVGFGAVGFLDDYLKITRRSHHGLIPRYKMGGQILVALGVGVAVLMLVAAESAALQHAADLSVLQEPDSRSRLVLRAVRGDRARRRDQRRQPDRRSRRPGDQHVRRGGRGVHRAGLRHRPRGARRLPAARPLPAGGRADDLLRRARRRQPRLPLVQLATPPRSSWATSARSALGGALGTVAILIKQELLLPIVGGVFVLEALSVIIQVASFKLTGKRVFKMAPLHHHFELIGWSEPKVITRFLIVAIIFALFSLTTLKLR